MCRTFYALTAASQGPRVLPGRGFLQGALERVGRGLAGGSHAFCRRERGSGSSRCAHWAKGPETSWEPSSHCRFAWSCRDGRVRRVGSLPWTVHLSVLCWLLTFPGMLSVSKRNLGIITHFIIKQSC